MAWVIQNGKLTNTEFIEMPESPLTAPYTASVWRIDPLVNNGRPYHDNMIGLPKLNVYIEPSEPLIHVYSPLETDFEHNGLAIIDASECEVRHEENGMYAVTMTVPLDSNGKHKHLKKWAYMRIPIKYHGRINNQLFYIKEVNRAMDSAGNCTIQLEIEHVFYLLANYCYYNKSFKGLTGQEALNTMISQYGMYNENSLNIPFSATSDILKYRTAVYHDISPVNALLGADNCFINLYGGKLYRDNFRFSINEEMESYKTTGVISYGYNMTEIEFTEDVSECVTWLRAYDNFGNSKIIQRNDIPNETMPHHIYKVVQFSYSENDREQFERDAQDYFDKYSVPQVNIKVKFAELTDYELYKDFLDLADFEVGDKVIIYHKDLDINYGNLEIISKTYDVVNKKTLEIEIGSFKNSVARSAYMGGTISTGASATDKQLNALQSQINEVAFDAYIQTPITTIDGKYLTTADGKYLIYVKE